MRVDVVDLPGDLTEAHLGGRVVVVFDVLRATTSMLAALNAGAAQIRVFDSIHAARKAAGVRSDNRLLCGEVNCRRPKGFNLGNSPREFSAKRVKGRTLFMSTTNGTKAILAARGADEILIGALVNASAIAKYLNQCGKSVTMLCAGTGGDFAVEDYVGAGAVVAKLRRFQRSKPSQSSANLFRLLRPKIARAIRHTRGGENVVAAGLKADINFAARVDAYDFVGRVLLKPLRVVRV